MRVFKITMILIAFGSEIALGATNAQNFVYQGRLLNSDGSATNWTAVAFGSYHACGIAGGALYCWGSNDNGQLGLGNVTQFTTPQQVGLATNWTSISAGDDNTCGVAGASLYCWGGNTNGQLGLGNGDNYYAPELVP